MRSMVEGTPTAAKIPLHRATRGPPPLEIEGRKDTAPSRVATGGGGGEANAGSGRNGAGRPLVDCRNSPPVLNEERRHEDRRMHDP